ARRWTLWGAALVVVAAAAAALLFTMNRKAPADHRGSAQLSAKAHPRPWTSPSPSLSLQDLSALASPSTVQVLCGDRRSTGFFVARDLVLTGLQATAGCFSLQIVTAGGKALDGVVTRQDAQLRLALAHVAGSGAEPLRLGDAAAIRSGDRIVLVGVPGAGAEGVHEAHLGGPARVFHGLVYLPIEGDFRSAAAGGPVLDGRGYVVGVMVPPEETDGNAFLLPINYTYDESHLLERPVPGPDLPRWKALLTEVALTEKLRVEPLQTPGAPPPESSPSTQ
ncbi:MAG: serine protease, partial [Thermoanaerobaculia bacterium]